MPLVYLFISFSFFLSLFPFIVWTMIIIIEILFKVKHVYLGIEKCKEMEEAIEREGEKKCAPLKLSLYLLVDFFIRSLLDVMCSCSSSKIESFKTIKYAFRVWTAATKQLNKKWKRSYNRCRSDALFSDKSCDS